MSFMQITCACFAHIGLIFDLINAFDETGMMSYIHALLVRIYMKSANILILVIGNGFTTN